MSDDNKLDRVMFYVLFFTTLILFMFIGNTVHAEEININSSVYGDTGYSNMYWGQNWYNGSLSNSNFSIGTRYSGRLRDFVLDIRRSFVANTVYTIYVYAATTDFRNTLEGVIVDDITNSDSCTVFNSQFISKTKLKTSFACGHNTSRISVMWFGPEQGYLTGDTNFNINKITLELETTSGSNNDDIINSANENTQDIINNNNSNTEDIINNQNENTQDIIDSQNQNTQDIISNQTCPVGPLQVTFGEWSYTKSKYLDENGNEVAGNSFGISPYFIVKPNTTYTINTTGGNVNSSIYYCTYNSQKQKQYCYSYNSGNTATNTLTTNQFAQYIRISIQNSRTFSITGPICNNWEQQAINDINDILNDSNVDNDLIDNVLDVSFYGNNDLTSIITAPLTILNSLLTTNTCQPLELPFHLDIGDYDNTTNAYLPCGDVMWSNAPSSVVTGYRLVICAFIFYKIGISLYHTLDGFLDPFKDNVEVLDL